MILKTLIFLIATMGLATESAFAANEERFEWDGIEFCRATVSDILHRYDDSEHVAEFEVVKAVHTGHAFGAEYNELYFFTRPDHIITGVIIVIESGDTDDIELMLDELAAQRWPNGHSKSDPGDAVVWLGHRKGQDVQMHLLYDRTTPFFDIGRSDNGKKSTHIAISSVTACDRAKELSLSPGRS